MTRLTLAKLYLGIVVLMILSLQGSGAHGASWFLHVFALPAVTVATIALAARCRTTRADQGPPPWEARRRPTTPPTTTE